MNFTLLPSNHWVASSTPVSYRACVGRPRYGRPSRGLTSFGGIMADAAGQAATRNIALYHLRWRHVPTPFVSAFNSYNRALGWADFLESQGHQEIYIVVVDTYAMTDGHLWDAYSIARSLGVVGEDLLQHENEYLFLNAIPAERILAVIPAMGRRVRLNIHLGQMTVPQSYLQMLPSRDVENIKQHLKEEIYLRHGVVDQVRLLQTTHALCTARWD